MTIANGYTTLAVLKSELKVLDTDDDTRFERVIEAVSRQIDDYCGFPDRHFYASSSASLHYTPNDALSLYIVDAQTVTAVAVDADGDGTYEEAWTLTTDYILAPYNAAAYSRPYTRIEIPDVSGKAFPVGVPKSVRVTGVSGWLAIPDVVEEACILQSARIYKRSGAPFGIAGSLEAGSEMRLLARLDPDVEFMLHKLRRDELKVA